MNEIKYIVPFVVAFGITVSIMPAFIGYFQIKKLGQPTLKYVKQHAKKIGKPTMGGLIFLTSALIATIVSALCLKMLTVNLLAIVFILLWYGLLGFLDDFFKIFKQLNEGLNPKQKFFGQILGGIIFFGIFSCKGTPWELNFFGLFNLKIGLFYALFIIFWLVGFSNAFNLTDGIDGLVAILGTISLAAYGIIALKQKQYDLFLVIVSLIGSLLAFFVFNFKPAKIFMGDVGSLALGGALAAFSILLHQEWTLLIIGIVYVIETLSVMLQVVYFKLTGGKRIFRMTPIHHHFELGGFSGHGKSWGEWKIVLTFGLFALISAALVLFYIFVTKKNALSCCLLHLLFLS